MNTIAYLRISSTDKTENIALIKMQKFIVDKWANSKNKTIKKYYIDTRFTMHNKKRIQFEQMITDISNNNENIDEIIVTDFYKLARITDDVVRVLMLSENFNIKITVINATPY